MNSHNFINKETKVQKSIIKNVFFVALSNIVSLLSGVLVGFIIPKIMGEINYGYYKTFVLYTGYIGLFHFGFCDGIYLLFAGLSYDKIDRNKFRAFSKFYLLFQTIVSLLVCVASLFFIDNYMGFIIFGVGLCLFSTNITTYYQFISQITMRFNELSVRNIVQAVVRIACVGLLYIMYRTKIIDSIGYKIYIIIYLSISFFISIWYIITYKDITFGKSISIKNVKDDIINFFLKGIPLLVANLACGLILSIDKQFVSVLVNANVFQMGEFGVYSFAYSMLALITTVISALSTVLYPSIKTMSEEKLKANYNNLIAIISIVVSFMLLAYQPFCFLIKKWLPNYSTSLPIFRIILPGLLLSSCVTLIIFNYNKAMGHHLRFFCTTMIILIVSIVADFVAYHFFGTLEAISSASILVIALWFLNENYLVCRKWKLNSSMNILFIFFSISGFYISSYLIDNLMRSFIYYFAYIACLCLVFYHKTIGNMLHFKKKKF